MKYWKYLKQNTNNIHGLNYALKAKCDRQGTLEAGDIYTGPDLIPGNHIVGREVRLL